MRILLVEDDKDIVQFGKKGLVEKAFSVDVATNGEEGLQLASHMKYDDLIVLDIMLPKMDGREVLKGIRSMDIQTPGCEKGCARLHGRLGPYLYVRGAGYLPSDQGGE